MKNVRFTTAGIMLTLAIAAAGGILLIDTSFLRPRVEAQKISALKDRAGRAAQAVTMVLHEDRHHLAAAAVAAAAAPSVAESMLTAPSDPAGITGIDDLAADATLAWATDTDGKLVGLWARPDAEGKSVVAPADEIEAADAGGGLMRLQRQWFAVASAGVPHPSGSGKSVGKLWLAQPVTEASLIRAGLAAGGKVLLVEADELPANSETDATGGHGFWTNDDGNMVMVSALTDADGTIAGYIRADLPAAAICQLAASGRRTTLIVLALSGGVAVLVIMGVHILVVGPVLRLLRRVDALRTGSISPTEVLNDLHGEPKMLAQELVQAFDRLAAMSRTDELTGLANRRHFEQVLAAFYHQARRYNRPLSLVLLDIDFFKSINDAGGHQLGDDVLRRVGKILAGSCRQADLPARVGGDELCVILPETSAADAIGMAERVRKAVAAEAVNVRGVEMRLTISIGIADLNAAGMDSPGAMMALADEALYMAKANGRNRVVQASDLPGLVTKGVADESDRIASLRSKLAGLDDDFKGILIRGVETLTQVLAERDPHRIHHAHRARRYAKMLAEEIQLPGAVIKRVEVAAVLHDIGMAALPDDVLLCEGALTEDQAQLMQRHSLLSVRIMEGMAFLEQEIPTVRYHHERFDGMGYPEGLTGAGIPLTARILAVADAFAAMTAPRNYRTAWSVEDALEELRKGSGSQFDPVVVDAFASLAEHAGVDAMMPVPPADIIAQAGPVDG